MSGVILMVGALAIASKGIDFGIDFESGTRIKTPIEQEASTEDVRDALPSGLQDAEIQEVDEPDLGENVFQISTDTLEPEEVAGVRRSLDEELGVRQSNFSSSSIGPTFGEQIARTAIIAVIASLVLIAIYIGLRFEFKYTVPVLIALFHDILITAGVYALADREVTTSTVAALLTILGYSLYDTIIVFDRIRENVPRMPRAAFTQIINRSMAEVLTRSLATSLCTLLPVTALMLFGGETLRDFAFALLVGIASGAYSSIFIASPVLTAWKEREPAYRRKRERIAEQMGHVPAFPEENVVARLDDEPEPEGGETEPALVAPAPSRASQPPPPPAPPAPEQTAPTTPVTPPVSPGAEPDGDGDGEVDASEAARKHPELSEASAAALERMRKERSGGRKSRRRRKHGRPR
jgi:SecD/SecF fusion protein